MTRVCLTPRPRAVPGLTRDLLHGLQEVPGQARDNAGREG